MKHAGEEERTTHLIVRSRFGPVDIGWAVADDVPSVIRIDLAPRDLHTGLQELECPEGIRRFGEMVGSFLEGALDELPMDLIRLDLCSGFQRRVLLAERGIPRGMVSTYGLIAVRVGSPGAARAVGSALASNPFPLVIPCHRAIRSDRSLGGFQGGAGMKRALLEMEGVEFGATGLVEPGSLYY